MDFIILIFGYAFLAITVISLIKYIYLSKKYKQGLKVFSISVAAYTAMCIAFTIAETILYTHIEYTNKLSGRFVLYVLLCMIHGIILITLYYLSSIKIIFSEDEFIYFNILGIKRRVKYSEASYTYNIENGKYIIYFKKKKLMVPYFVENQMEIEKYIKKAQ